MKLFLILAVSIFLMKCDKPPTPQPSPVPTATPSPVETPTPTARVYPTPYPVPAVDLAPYLHEQDGVTVAIDIAGINAADALLGTAPGKIVVSGGGSITTQIVVSHDLEFRLGTYSCDTQTLEGCILLKNNVKAEAKGDVTILEPTFIESGVPAITVFQAYAGAKNNGSASENITVKGFKIRGRQTKTDGGVRQAISFGNCKNCAAIENDLDGIASIGIQFGGSAADGNHAVNVLAYRNKLRSFAAAAIALVNVDKAVVAENDIANPGRRVGEPGGISAIDIETNNTDDCVRDIKIFNNRIDFGTAAFFSIGNGILGQNVYFTQCAGGLLIANNTINGRGTVDEKLGLSSGLYFVGNWAGSMVTTNRVTRALQMGIVGYGLKGMTLQDNWIEHSGGGGNPSVYLIGGGDNSFQRNRIFELKDLPQSFDTSIWVTKDAVGNVFNNAEDGGIAVVATPLKAKKKP